MAGQDRDGASLVAHLYHSTCYDSLFHRFLRWIGYEPQRMPRFRYDTSNPPGWAGVPRVEVDRIHHTQTFVCDTCGDTVHFDTDWLDGHGGFIGEVTTEGRDGYYPKLKW